MSQDARDTTAYLELALNKFCRVELVTSQIVFIMALSHIRALIFLYIPLRIHRWIFLGKAEHTSEFEHQWR